MAANASAVLRAYYPRDGTLGADRAATHFVFTPKTTTPSQTASDSPFSMGEAAVAERLAHEGSGGKRKASQQKRKVGHKPPTWRQLEAEELIIRKVQLPPSIGSGGGGGGGAKVAMKAHVSVIMMLALCVPATGFSCTPHVKPSQRSLLSPHLMAEVETEKWDVGTEATPDMSLTAQQDESVAYMRWMSIIRITTRITWTITIPLRNGGRGRMRTKRVLQHSIATALRTRRRFCRRLHRSSCQSIRRHPKRSRMALFASIARSRQQPL